MVVPRMPCPNLQRLAIEGSEAQYGFYEAIDYTPSLVRRADRLSLVIGPFMAHHQGMTLLSLAYVLLDRPMQRRFEADPQFQATMRGSESSRSNRVSRPHIRGFRAPYGFQSCGSAVSCFLQTPIRRALKCSCSPTAGTT